MAKSHSRVYPTVYIRQSVLNSLQPSLRQLEQRTDTTVFYNEAGGYFDITGPDQTACDKARDKIATALLPRLNQSIDEHNLKGTYKTLDIIRDEDLIGVPVTSEPEVKVVKIDGQPLKLDQDEKEHEEVEQDSGDDDKLIIDTFIVSPKVRSLKDFLTSSIQQNMQNGDYLKLVGKATRTDCAIMNRSITISGFDEESVNDALDRFKVIQTTYLGLSKRMLIPCIDYPPQYAESGLYYCSMNNYKKKASLQSQFFTESDISDLYILLPVFMDPHKGQYGPPKDLILAHDQEQLHRQRMYQYQIQQQKQMYGAEQQRNREAMMDRIKKTASVNMNYKQVSPAMMRKNQASRNMVMSYPTPPPPPSNKVVHTRHPPPAQTPSPLPSSAKIVHTRQPPSTKIVHTRQPHTSPSTPIPQQQYQYQQQRQHDHTQAYPSPQRIPTPSSQRAPTPSSPPTYMSSPPTGPVNGDYSRASSASGSRQYSSSDNESLSTLDEFRPPLWGNDRSFINVYNSGVSSLSIDDEVKPPSINDIPMLTKMDEIPRRRPSSRASSVKSVESGRRVMRIVNLKSANVAPVTKTPWQIKDDYNFENIKAGLEEGLGAVRGFKGEIRLSAKLGKILWGPVPPDVREIFKRIWDYTDIKDIIVREHNVQPYFSERYSTTIDNGIVDSITDRLPNRDSVSYTYEFHCLARSMPQCEYKPTVLYMNESAMDLTKVSVAERKLTQVDWVSLDRKMDFQMALTTKELVRPNAKPYTTFIKWVSVCPTTRAMTFEEVKDFLYVEHVLHKETSRYKVIPYSLEITRVEKVVLREVKSNQFTKAKKLNCQINTGGEVWYDIELVHPAHALRFKSNIDLETGKVASWNIEDILGENDSSELRNYLAEIKKLVNITEQALHSSNIN